MNKPHFLGFTPDCRARYAADYWLDHHGVPRPPIAGGAPDTSNDQIDASLDDAYEIALMGTMNVDCVDAPVYSHPDAQWRRWAGIRFHNGPFPPQGSTITVAYFELWPYIDNDAYLDIHAENLAAPPTFNLDDHNISGRARTTASVLWAEDGLSSDWNESPSIVSVIQELVDSFTPTAIVLVLKPYTDITKYVSLRAWDYSDHTYGAKLHLEWTEGGETFYKSVAGTITPEGALSRQTSVSPSGTLSSSGAIIKKAVPNVLSGVLASSGVATTVRTRIASLAGTLASSGTLVAKGHKMLAGTLTSAGSLIRKTPASFAGVLAPTGYLAAKKLVGVTFKTLTGTLTSSGTLARKTATTLAGSLTSAGTVAKKTTRTMAGTLTSAGAVVGSRWQPKALAGTLSSAGTLAAKGGKALAGVLSSSGEMATTLYKFIAPISLSGTLTPTGAVTATKIALQSVAGTLTSSGALATQFIVGKAIGGTVTSAGVLTAATRKALGGTLTSSGGVVKRSWLALAGVVGAAGSLIARLLGPGKMIRVTGSVDTTLTVTGSVDTTLQVEGSDDTTIQVEGEM